MIAVKAEHLADPIQGDQRHPAHECDITGGAQHELEFLVRQDANTLVINFCRA